MEKHADGFNGFNCLSTLKISAEQQSKGQAPRAPSLPSDHTGDLFVKIKLKISSELWLSLAYVMDEVSDHEVFKGSGTTMEAHSVQWCQVGGSQSGAG